MSPDDARELAIQKLAFRIEPHMAQYLADQLSDPHAVSPIPLMGGCAKTGACERRLVDPNSLRGPQNFSGQKISG